MKKILLNYVVLLFALGISQSVYAQNRTVSGKVTSAEDNISLPGVNVAVKGTTIGTATDADGTYALSVPANATLIFSFIGLTSQEIEVGNRSTLDVKMASDVKSLSEVVVVGYGSQEKRDLTGSITSVSGKTLENIPVPSLESAIQGRAAGVFIESGSGKVGQGIKIRVRGSSSVTAGNQPLYVVDGIPITAESQTRTGNDPTNPLADINPNDIESIEVLKDASSGAIYGSRASNGVILITTKKGKTGKTNFNLGYYQGVSNPTNKVDFLNAAQYVEFYTEATANVNRTPDALFNSLNPDWKNGTVDTDWQGQAFKKNAQVKQFDISASGGTEKTRFYLGGSYTDQEGILINNSFERYSGRINLDHSATDKLRFGANLSLARTQNNRVANDNQFYSPMQLVAQSPLSPIRDETGEFNRFNVLYDNGLIDAAEGFEKATVYRTISSLYGSYEFIPGLTFRSEFGLDLLNQTEESFQGSRTVSGGGTNGFARNRNVTVVNYTTNNFVTFNRTLNEIHNLELVGGMSYQQASTETAEVQGQQFPNDDFKKIVSAAEIPFGSSTGTKYSYLSYFSRANYKFNNKYLLSLSARLDGSSRFGEDNRYGIFPAASLGWIISEESFLQSANAVSLLKLRGSYGITGNSEIGNFDSRGLYEGTTYPGLSGIRPVSVASPDLKWETTAQFNVGLDFGVFNNRISGSFDYYTKKTTDLLLNVNVPATTGFTTVTKNVGKLENKGFEVLLNTENLTGAFRWTTSFNFARNRNKITDLGGQVIEGTGRGPNRAVEGEPIGVFYTVKYAGVDPANGDALYYVREGSNETTNNYNSAQRQVVGDPNPDFTGGITNTFSFKGFDLSVLFQFTYGNDIFGGGGTYFSSNGRYWDNQTTDQLRRWRNPGDVTDVPQARRGISNGDQESSRWIYDGSFLRLKNASLGYTLPKALVSKAYLTNVRLYVTGQNLITFTDYPLWDPEVSTDVIGNIAAGVDFYTAPQARTIIVGVNIGF